MLNGGLKQNGDSAAMAKSKPAKGPGNGGTGGNRGVQTITRAGARKVEIVPVSDDSSDPTSSSASDNEVQQPSKKKMRYGVAVTNGRQPSRSQGAPGGKLQRTKVNLVTIDEEMDGGDTDGDIEVSWASMAEIEDDTNGGSQAVSRGVGGNAAAGPSGEKRGNGKGSQQQRNDKGECIETSGGFDDVVRKQFNKKKESYAGAAKKAPWNTVNYGKKRKATDTKGKRPLKGTRSVVQRDIYIQGLDFEYMNDYVEMEDTIQEYCRDNGVSVLYMRIIPTKFDRTRLGCKISVKETDFERVMEDDFWPDDVTVREWVRKPRNEDGPEGQL